MCHCSITQSSMMPQQPVATSSLLQWRHCDVRADHNGVSVVKQVLQLTSEPPSMRRVKELLDSYDFFKNEVYALHMLSSLRNVFFRWSRRLRRDVQQSSR